MKFLEDSVSAVLAKRIKFMKYIKKGANSQRKKWIYKK